MGLEGGADGYLTQSVEPRELIATVRPCSASGEAEEAARVAARQWQATFDAINDGVALIDASGVGPAVQLVARRNPRAGPRLDGRPSLRGPRAGRSRRPGLRASARQPRRETLDLAHGGRWLHVTVDPIPDDGEAVAGAVAIVSDVTEHRRLEEELKRRAADLVAENERKNEFLADAGPRAPQPARPDPPRPGVDPPRRRQPGHPRAGTRGRREAGRSPGPARRRPARRRPDHARQDPAPTRDGRTEAPS